MPGLSQYDRSDDATPQARAERARARGGSKLPESELRFGYAPTEDLLAAGLSHCWCQGTLCGPQWQWVGKDRGLPHPDSLEELALRIERELDSD